MLQTLGRPRRRPAPGTYRLDRDHCLAQFSVRHFMVSAVRGTLQPVDGTLVVDADVDASSVHVDLDAASLDTGLPEHDSVLTGPRFLDAGQFPRVWFASRKVVGSDPSRFALVGDLRVGERTTPISLSARVASVREGAVSFAATGSLSRADVDLGWSRAAEGFGLVVGDAVRLTVGAEFVGVHGMSGVLRSRPLRSPRRLRLAVAGALAFLAAGVGVAFAPMSSAQTPPGVDVVIMGYEFTPAALSVPVGTTVTWTNHDSAPHNVVSTGSGGVLDSPTLQQGDSWSFTFTQPGTYSYFCEIHPDMTGTITVTGSPGTTTPTTPPPTTVPPGTCPSGGLLSGVLDPFWAHLQGAHLQTPVGQQVTEALDVDTYVQTHTILAQHMLAPAYTTLSSALNSLAPFWVHLQGAHLQTPVGQQVTEALDVDKYVQTHTVLVEKMLEPTVDPLLGTC